MRRWIALVAVSLGVATIIVDSTIVNVAIPSIVRDLDASSTDVLWIQESYTLVFAALLLAFGGIADAVGRRRVLLVGIVLFAVASLAAALAPDPGLLIGARLVQGVGGAMVLPTTLSILNATFSGRERGIAFAVWGSTIGGMTALGPLLGGWLTTDFSWRWAFGINIVLGAIIVVGTLVFVDESRGGARGVDAVGAALSAVACAALVFGLIEGRSLGWWTTTTTRLAVGGARWPAGLSPVPIAFALAVVAGVAFVLSARRRERRGRPSMLAIDLFRIRSFRNGNLTAMIVSLGEFGIVLALPIWLQNGLGYTAVGTGLVLLALAIGSFAASGLAAALSGRLAAVLIVRIGLGAEIVGVAAIGAVVSTDTSWLALVPCLFVYGFGVGLATAQLTGVVLVDVPVEDGGRGSGTQSTSRQIGSALGIAVLGTTLYSVLGGVLTAKLTDAGTSSSAATRIADAVVNSSGAAIAQLPAPVASAAAAALADGTRIAAFVAAGFLVIGLAATRSLGPRSVAGPGE